MKLKHREIQRALQEIQTRLEPLIVKCDELCYMANENMDSGVSGISYDSKSRSSGPADPVGARAERGHRDRVEYDARRLLDGIRKALDGIRLADAAAWGLRALTEDEAKILSEKDEISNTSEQTISATCANLNCQRPVARTANDRLREGRCENCYRYRHTHGEERPRLYCDAERNIASAFELDEDRVIVEGAA